MIEDRVALMTGGQIRKQLSVQEMLACDGLQGGCEGGAPETALEFLVAPGIVIDDKYPYEQEKSDFISPCKQVSGKRRKIKPDSIRSLCLQLDESEVGSQRHIDNILNMKREIYENGPIVGTIMVYSDLYDYSGQGVYSVTAGATAIGGHAIEIFGWSDENANTAEPNFQDAYWVCKNSWGYYLSRIRNTVLLIPIYMPVPLGVDSWVIVQEILVVLREHPSPIYNHAWL